MIYNNVLEAIGNTPIIRLNKIGQGLGVNLFVKVESMNPGGSVKDRIGWYLIEDAEKRGYLKPGGTIVESTSGNTGVGLAIAAAVKGYKCIFVLPDKMSQEKIKTLRAFGAKVIVTPTAVEPEDPRSYYSVSRRLGKEIPNAFYINQYDNLANREAHYLKTGPEILKQMPEVDVLVGGLGTGGTICGTSKYLKEKKPSFQAVAVDPLGSIVYDYFKTGKLQTQPKTYKLEGIGEDFIPKNYDFSVLDDMVQVEDKESFLMTRELLLKEGLFCGVSCGAAVVGALKWIKSQGEKAKGKNVLVILPDGGSKYLSKVFDDDWMKEAGFLDGESKGSVQDILNLVKPKVGPVVTVKESDPLSSLIDLMREKSISQIPVVDSAGWIKGIVNEGAILSALYESKVKPNSPASSLVESSIEFVGLDDSFEKVSRLVTSGKVVLVRDLTKPGQVLAILTKIDLLTYLEKHV